MRQAAAIRRRLSEAHGSRVQVGATSMALVPSPEQLLAVRTFPSVPDEKLARLHGIARAALEGRLDPARLRALPFDEAVADLERLDGVGPWTAQHIVLRGAALADALPTAEPRVLAGLAEAYRLEALPSPRAFAELAERWRPYRMWVAILLVRLAMASPAPQRTGSPRRAAPSLQAGRA